MNTELIQRLRQDGAEMREYAGKCGGHALEGLGAEDSLIAYRWARYAYRSARYALDLEEAATALERLTCETCDGTGVVRFCPDPSDSNCGNCEKAPCPECGHLGEVA